MNCHYKERRFELFRQEPIFLIWHYREQNKGLMKNKGIKSK